MQHRTTFVLLFTILGIVGLAGCGPSPVAAPVATAAQPAVQAAEATSVPPTALAAATQPDPTAAPTRAAATSTEPPAQPPTPAPEATPIPTLAAPATLLPADPAAVRVEVQEVLRGLDRPVGIAHAGDGSGRLFIVEKAGRIQIVRDGRLVAQPFLDITDRVGSGGNEQGLLGLAFQPNYRSSGLLYVNYTDRRGDTVVARFTTSADPDRADPGSETVVLTLGQPAANHNGGHLAFGPDGMLYIGTGDGGGSGDRYGNGQNGQSLLGKMLRIDVDGDQPYAIPANNPFVADPDVLDEIWAVGLRNPWRYSFDRQSGDLYIADVGQNQYEEVNVQAATSRGGENYGWPIMEGQHCYPEGRTCDRAALIQPAVEYDHTRGCSVTGGYAYRGSEFPLLNGIYLYGDYCSGTIWGMAPAGAGEWTATEMAQTGLNISSFGEGEAGELYLVDLSVGKLFKITASAR